MRFIVRTLAVFGLLAIIGMAVLIYGVSRIYVASHKHVPIAEGTVLTLTVEGPFVASHWRSPLGAKLPGMKPSRCPSWAASSL